MRNAADVQLRTVIHPPSGEAAAPEKSVPKRSNSSSHTCPQTILGAARGGRSWASCSKAGLRSALRQPAGKRDGGDGGGVGRGLSMKATVLAVIIIVIAVI